MERFPVHIRWLIPKHDLAHVVDIAAQGDRPWTATDFDAFRRKKNCICMVGEHDGLVIGFYAYFLFKHHLHLINLGVHTLWRRRGVGAQFIENLLSNLSLRGRRGLACEVHERNLDAQLFLKAQGFRWWRTLRDYFERGEDAYLMERHVIEETSALEGIESERHHDTSGRSND